KTRMVEVTESRPSRHTAERNRLVAEHWSEFHRLGGDASTRHDCPLLGTNAEIVAIADDFLGTTRRTPLRDVSAMPKRFFFPLLRQLWTAMDGSGGSILRDLLVTYTVPREYAGGALSENASEWAPLPLFGGAYHGPKPEMFILSIGFDALGL